MVGAHFLEMVFRDHGNFEKTITLGRQELHSKVIGGRARALSAFERRGVPFADDFIVSQFGASELFSLDASPYEGASHIWDLNHPIPDEFKGQFNTVIDLGTLEHIFNVPVALRSLSQLCEVGGRVIHVLPLNGQAGHGLYQFSPGLFISVYSIRNGYKLENLLIAEVDRPEKFYRISPDAWNTRIEVSTRRPAVLLVTATVTEHISETVAQQPDYVAAWQEDRTVSLSKSRLRQAAAANETLYNLAWTALRGVARVRGTGALSGRNRYLQVVRAPTIGL